MPQPPPAPHRLPRPQRVILIVLDSVGIGELPDAAAYGDQGSNTLGNIATRSACACRRCARSAWHRSSTSPASSRRSRPRGRLWPHGRDVAGQGLGHRPLGADGARARSALSVFPHGFPRELIAEFERAHRPRHARQQGRLRHRDHRRARPEHMRTGKPIVYTSADSVFQIAAHEDVVPVPELYRYLRDRLRARRASAWASAGSSRGRSSASPGAFKRTANRRDFALTPFAPTLLDRLKDAGLPVVAIGKIDDLFAGRGITRAVHTTSDDHGMDEVEPGDGHDAERADLREPRGLRHRLRAPQRRRRIRRQPRALRRAARGAAAAASRLTIC